MITELISTWPKEKVILAFLLLLGITGGVFTFSFGYFSNTNVLIGVCLFPFTILVTGDRRNNFFYVGLVLVFAALAVIYKVRIFYFFVLAFYFLWVIEILYGRLNVLILFLVVFMSPFFIQVVTILGFPLRLLLSEYAGALLNIIGIHVEVQGNVMILENSVFNVDEACMGLNMLVISMLMGVFILFFRYRVSGTTLGLLHTIQFFLITFFLNMLANLFRIISLVYFRIPAENTMHEFVGILCLVAYVVIPLHFLSGILVRQYGKQKTTSTSNQTYTRTYIIFLVILPLAVLFTGLNTERERSFSNIAHANIKYGKLKPELLSDGISKIYTGELLIYVKAIPEFFTGEHTPLMCWKGSGYEFSGITTTTISGVTIYTGTLVDEGKSLHTAWWYSNGKIETISQLDWRTRMLKGEDDFCLVNVTAEDERTLLDSIDSMLKTRSLIIKS